MIASTLIASIVLLKPPLEIEVKFTKSSYRPGEAVKYEVFLRNAGVDSVVVARPVRDGGLAAWLGIDILRGRTEVTPVIEGTRFLGQVMVNRTVSTDRFVTLQPNERMSLCRDRISKQYRLTGSPGLKSSYENAKTENLAPGNYTVNIEYAFPDKTFFSMVSEGELEFAGNSKQLYNRAFRGTVKKSATFSVQ